MRAARKFQAGGRPRVIIGPAQVTPGPLRTDRYGTPCGSASGVVVGERPGVLCEEEGLPTRRKKKNHPFSSRLRNPVLPYDIIDR